MLRYLILRHDRLRIHIRILALRVVRSKNRITKGGQDYLGGLALRRFLPQLFQHRGRGRVDNFVRGDHLLRVSRRHRQRLKRYVVENAIGDHDDSLLV